VPGPLPEDPAVTVMNASLLDAVHPQPPVDVTLTAPVPAADVKDAVEADKPYEHERLGHNGPGQTAHETPPCDEHVPDASASRSRCCRCTEPSGRRTRR
jgi:hypothetical protein